jgi:hypothetical protein
MGNGTCRFRPVAHVIQNRTQVFKLGRANDWKQAANIPSHVRFPFPTQRQTVTDTIILRQLHSGLLRSLFIIGNGIDLQKAVVFEEKRNEWCVCISTASFSSLRGRWQYQAMSGYALRDLVLRKFNRVTRKRLELKKQQEEQEQ